MYNWVSQSISPILNYAMFNTYMVWKPYSQIPGIPGHAIYHYSLGKYIKDGYRV